MLQIAMTAMLWAALGAAQAPRTLFDFEGPPPTVEPQGATAEVIHEDGEGALRIEFPPAQGWPGVSLPAPEGRWDLSEFDRVQADVRNLGDAPVRIFLRVDNPGADGRRHCNTEATRLDAGQSGTLTVVFGRSWGGAGFPLDASNVVALLFFVDNPDRGHAVAVDEVRAGGSLAQLPDWLGQRPPVPGEWSMTLNEEFDGEELNTNLWNTRLNWDGPLNSALHAYTARRVSVEDGLLKIAVVKGETHQWDDPNLPSRPYSSGIITTYDKFTQRYGYFEARIKMPRARGLWPAWWMMPDRGPDAGIWWRRASTERGANEVDIMEHLTEWGPGRYNVATHWDGYGEDHKSWGDSKVTYKRTPDGYHAFGLLWEPARMTFYCDGEEKATWRSEHVSKVPCYLKLCVQMGGWATKNVDDAALPDAMLVDYVRVWQRPDLAARNQMEGQTEARPQTAP
jgi:beta-glucanase (GH16 family)